MKIYPLKIYFYVWAVLVIFTVWMDRWYVTISSGTISCLLGTMAATTPIKADDPKAKEYRHVGIALMVIGCVASLMEIADKFLLKYFIR